MRKNSIVKNVFLIDKKQTSFKYKITKDLLDFTPIVSMYFWCLITCINMCGFILLQISLSFWSGTSLYSIKKL